MTTFVERAALLTVLALGAACAAGEAGMPAGEDESVSISDITTEQWERLAERRIFFGHQSVGDNLVSGMQAILAEHPEIRLRLVESNDPSSVEGPAFIESHVGRNLYPESKSTEFAAIVESDLGPGDVAMHKYCYVDMGPESDPDAIFEGYRATIDALRASSPGVEIVHITTPLRADRGWLDHLKRRIRGRTDERELNAKRNRFNELLIAEYEGVDPIFDIAAIQSTRRDGTRSTVEWDGQTVYTLAEEWTYDGGHFTDEGAVYAAERFLVFLATLPANDGVPAPRPGVTALR